MNANQYTTVDGAESLEQVTDLSLEQAINIVDLVERRNDLAGSDLMLVKISDWIAQQWENDYGVSSEYVLVDKVEDYSAKAWLVEGGLLVTDEGLNEAGASISSGLAQVDHGTQEYPRDKGTTWIPKGQEEGIFAFQ